jgi:hypothetical protein
MKLAAIYNVWDGEELLIESIKTIYDHVDMVIIIYQTISNYDEVHDPTIVLQTLLGADKVKFMKYDPIVEMGGPMNERAKRNFGIEFARDNKCTHFFSIDCDEFYENFEEAKRLYIESGKKGSVCKLQTYFKKPTFRFDIPEDYYVPFIHELNADTKTGSSSYPFWVDPTRAINQNDLVVLPIFMHHFSWVRKDIERKARNSSVAAMIKNSTIFNDYNSPKLGEGYFLANWNRKIVVVDDIFGLMPLYESFQQP